MDPNELFVVSRISRKDIAENLWLEPNDPRLTNALCEEYSEELGDISAETADEEDDLAFEMTMSFKERHNLGS